MRNALIYSSLLVFVLVLSACQVNQVDTTAVVTPDNPGVLPTLVVLALPAVEIAERPTQTIHVSNPQPSATLVSNAKPAEAKKPVQVCSPLGGFSLDELPGIVSAPYAPPPAGREERHHGVDFSFYNRGDMASIDGVLVQSMLAGRVAAATLDRFPYGNMVIIETSPADLGEELRRSLGMSPGESLYILYAHMAKEPDVEPGEKVPACFPLGSVGKSGNADVAHLHLETRLGAADAQLTSMAYYTTQSTQEERDHYELWRTSGMFRHFDPLDLLARITR